MSEEKQNIPFDLPPVRDLLIDEEYVEQEVKINVLFREEGDLDKALDEIIKRSNQLSSAMMTAYNIISDFTQANKTEAHKRIERITRSIWTYLLANRVNAGIKDKTEEDDDRHER